MPGAISESLWKSASPSAEWALALCPSGGSSRAAEPRRGDSGREPAEGGDAGAPSQPQRRPTALGRPGTGGSGEAPRGLRVHWGPGRLRALRVRLGPGRGRRARSLTLRQRRREKKEGEKEKEGEREKEKGERKRSEKEK